MAVVAARQCKVGVSLAAERRRRQRGGSCSGGGSAIKKNKDLWGVKDIAKANQNRLKTGRSERLPKKIESMRST